MTDGVLLVDVTDGVLLADVTDGVLLVDVADGVLLVDVADGVLLVGLAASGVADDEVLTPDPDVPVGVPVVGAAAPVGDAVRVDGVVPATPGVAELPGPSSCAWRKTTVSDPVLASCWTCTSATNPCGSAHGSAPPGRAVPATWTTFPRKR